ncbi:MAG TPA: NAD-dependent epimerase/dehydratase family protein [Actinomycetes bacterium]|nr:NAD-dependent epimerase/dehydratase family protein [Actinomycetes bacterium]
MKVLVTGASGMLGAATARALVTAGHTVTVLQRRASGLGVAEVRGDITDDGVVRWACTGQDAVVHLAARVTLTGSWEDFERVNVGGTRTVLAAARAAGATRFIHVSSPSVAHSGSALVGVAAGPADPDAARGHYARSKAVAERMALAAGAGDFAVVAVRPHLVWGPGDTQLVGRVVERARTGRLMLVGGGGALIDSTYVDNAADALVASLHRIEDLRGQSLVVTNGEPRTVRELLTAICRAAAVPEPTRSVPLAVAAGGGTVVERAWDLFGREDEPPMTRFLAEQLATAHWFDQRNTREALQWAPRVGLDEGFARLASWFARTTH